MSILNRKLTVGNHKIKHESKFQTFLGKLVCLFKGHREVIIKVDENKRKYCLCCWEELDK